MRVPHMPFVAVKLSMIKLCLLTIAASLALTACSTIPDPAPRRMSAMQTAQAGGMKYGFINIGPYKMLAATRITNPEQPTRVYIEGDGFAYITRTQPSPDPTPLTPMLLKLAADDKTEGFNIIYLGRPCQYDQTGCTQADWTTRRFTRDKFMALNAALDLIKSKELLKNFELVGYSGGAHFAALMGATRCDVTGLRTIAGNVDVLGFVETQNLSPLEVSPVPLDEADKLRTLPQLHLVSTADKVIPPKLINSYAANLNSDVVQVITVDKATHSTGWDGPWVVARSQPLPARLERPSCF